MSISPELVLPFQLIFPSGIDLKPKVNVDTMSWISPLVCTGAWQSGYHHGHGVPFLPKKKPAKYSIIIIVVLRAGYINGIFKYLGYQHRVTMSLYEIKF